MQKPAKYKVAVSRDSEKFYHVYRSHSLVGEENFPVKEMDEAELTAAENVTMENGESKYLIHIHLGHICTH